MAYSDWDEFDAEDYARRWYIDKITDIDRAFITGAMQTMKRMGLEPGCFQHAADVGTGPNMYPAMLLAPFVASPAQGGQLDLIEYSRPNLHHLQSSIAGHPTSPPAAIWQKFEQFMGDYDPVWRRTFGTMQSVASVVYGDIYSLPSELYDAVSAFFVSESITDSMRECERATASLLASVKPGGFVLVGHMLGSTGYPAGTDTLFPGVALTPGDLRRLYQGSLDDLTIIEPPFAPEGHDRYHGAALVIGRKKRAATSIANNPLEKIFTANDMQACLYDERRVAYLKQAIFETVRPGDVVVDAGSGTGVLGLIAVQAGASRVYCIEPNREYVHVIRQNAKNNGMQDKIIAIQGDATKVDLPESVDVIVCEVISGGFFDEPQLQILHNMKRFLKPGGRAVPAAMTNFIELVDAQDELYGLTFRYDTRFRSMNDTPLSTKSRYLAADFLQDTPFSISVEKTVRCMASGKANAVRISYALQFSEGVLSTEPTEFLLNPQVLFLHEPLWLHASAYYQIFLAYEAAASPLTCRLAVRAHTDQGHAVS